MESFFFNITDTRYKTTFLYKNTQEYINKIDISNGIVFFDIFLNSYKKFNIKNLDRMIAISVIKKGNCVIKDNIKNKIFQMKENSINIFASSQQDLLLKINKQSNTEIFVLFIADFVLKRYLSSNQNEIINFLYNNLQTDISCNLIDAQTIDALSLYIIDKITNTKKDDLMNSIICEHNVLEFMIHRFKLLDITNHNLSNIEICISKSAKDILLYSFISPPTIGILAHLCATNETKLKEVFKKAYNITIHSYIQKLRLEKANLLLRDRLLNIGEIAKQVGYKHQGYFSKLFFEYYGIYPKDLLKK